MAPSTSRRPRSTEASAARRMVWCHDAQQTDRPAMASAMLTRMAPRHLGHRAVIGCCSSRDVKGSVMLPSLEHLGAQSQQSTDWTTWLTWSAKLGT